MYLHTYIVFLALIFLLVITIDMNIFSFMVKTKISNLLLRKSVYLYTVCFW